MSIMNSALSAVSRHALIISIINEIMIIHRVLYYSWTRYSTAEIDGQRCIHIGWKQISCICIMHPCNCIAHLEWATILRVRTRWTPHCVTARDLPVRNIRKAATRGEMTIIRRYGRCNSQSLRTSCLCIYTNVKMQRKNKWNEIMIKNKKAKHKDNYKK